MLPSIDAIRRMNARDLADLVDLQGGVLDEPAAIAVLDNRYCSDAVCAAVAQNVRLSTIHAVRLRLVAHRSTPHVHSLKLIHYLPWTDLVRLAGNVRISPVVRHAIDRQLIVRIGKMSVGEKISIARRCSREVAVVLLYDPSPRVFGAVLINPRLREDDVVALIASQRVVAEQLRGIANDRKWSLRYPVRLGLVMNPLTPRAVAASQLRFLRRRDLLLLAGNPATSVYLRRCIERHLEEPAGERSAV